MKMLHSVWPVLLELLVQLIVIQGTTVFDYTSPSQVVRVDQRISAARSVTNKDFVLGGLFPIHISASGGGACGTIFNSGSEWMEAMLYSIDVINSDDTLLPNITLGYDIRDTCFSANIGLDEAVDLIQFGTDLERYIFSSCNLSVSNTSFEVPTSVIIGATGSHVSIPVASLLRLFMVPQISYASSSVLLSNRDRYGYFYRTYPSDDLQARAMIDIVIHFNWTYVSTIYSANAYGQKGIEEFHKLANQTKICVDINVGLEDNFQPEQFENLAELLISNSKSNVVVLFALEDHAASLIKAIHDKNTTRHFVWIASDAWGRSKIITNNYGPTVAGYIGFISFTSRLNSFHDYFTNLTLLTNNRNPWFEEYFVALTNCRSNNKTACNRTDNIPNIVATYEQDNVVPIVVDAVYTATHALNNFLMDNCQQPVQWFRNNRTCLNQTRELNGSALLEYIQKSNFTSPTGNRILFDNQGNVEGIYNIKNFQYQDSSNFRFQSMGVWNGTLFGSGQNSLQLNSSASFQFGIENGNTLTIPPQSDCTKCNPGNIRKEVPSSCCGLCEPCLGQFYSNGSQSSNCSKCSKFSWGNDPTTGNSRCVPLEVTYLRYSHPYSVIIMIIALAGFISVVIAILLYVIKWNTKIVKSSGREQMLFLLLGISLSFLAPFFFVSPPGKGICGIQRWILWTSFSIMFSALLVKVVRVARIFLQLRRGDGTRVRFIESQYQIIFTLILISIQWLILVFSTSLFPPDVNRDVRLNIESPNETPQLLHTCDAENIVLLVISVAYQTLLIILCTILGIISFTYPENFNEAKYISFCSFSVLVIWVAFIITLFATQRTREFHNIVLSLAVVMTGCAVYVTMFSNNMYIIIFRQEEKKYDLSSNDRRLETTTKSINVSLKSTIITNKEVSVNASSTSEKLDLDASSAPTKTDS